MSAYEVAFGGWIRDARASERVTQEMLAFLVNMSRPSIANIEAGRQGVSLSTAAAIAIALNRSPAEAFAFICGVTIATETDWRAKYFSEKRRADRLREVLRQLIGKALRSKEQLDELTAGDAS